MEPTCTICLKAIPTEEHREEQGTFRGRRCRRCYNQYQNDRRKAVRAGTWVPFSHRKIYVRDDTPRASRTPSWGDLCWAAGFLEGEGSFRRTNSGEEVQAPQVDPEPLLRLQAILGGKIAQRRIRNKPIHIWNVYGIRARGVMLTLYLLMSTRRQQQIRTALNR